MEIGPLTLNRKGNGGGGVTVKCHQEISNVTILRCWYWAPNTLAYIVNLSSRIYHGCHQDKLYSARVYWESMCEVVKMVPTTTAITFSVRTTITALEVGLAINYSQWHSSGNKVNHAF